MSADRFTEAEQHQIITDPLALAQREVENGIRQFNLMADIIRQHVKNGSRFRLKTRHILELQNEALSGINPLAGTFRNTPVTIKGSTHSPPHPLAVADEVNDLCGYINQNWEKSALHLAAYVLWRLNWIHPFADGNGRTARAVSYAVLCIRLDGLLPGAPTIPEQIAADKGPYYDALEQADRASNEGNIDVSELEQMLSRMLANQLLSIAALSETSEDRINMVVENRIRRASPELVTKIYGTDKPRGRTWQVGLDQIVFQMAADEELEAARNRQEQFGAPFPSLFDSEPKAEAQQISVEQDGTLLLNPKINQGSGLVLNPDVAIGLINPSVNAEGPESWQMIGALYTIKFGKSLSSDTAAEAIDLLIAKHLTTAKTL